MTGKKLGRGVAVVGAGMSRFGASPGRAGRDLFVDAFIDMRASVDRGLDPKQIQAFYLGNFSSELFEHQGQTAPILAEWIGLNLRPASRVEAAGASGGAALRQGILAVASGLYDVVLVGGVEKMSGLTTTRVTEILATAGDKLYEIRAGFTLAGIYAAMTTAYLDRYGLTSAMLLDVSIKNHHNGALNDKAHFQFSIAQLIERAGYQHRFNSEVAFLSDPVCNPVIASPLRLFDCSAISDGAAALLLVAEEHARAFSTAPLYVVGSGQAGGPALHDHDDLTSLHAAKLAAAQAYEMAGVQPADIRMAEVHDSFTIAEIIASEDLGFFKPGEGAHAARDGITTPGGRLPINTSGGLKARGHPAGATGVAQVVELWQQMRGEAGIRQVGGNLDLALAHNVGGAGQAAVVHIIERR